MSIAVHVHDNKPEALAELIAHALQDSVVIDSEPTVAHLSELVAKEERESARRRAAWHWLNTVSPKVDRDNDWSSV